MGKYIRTLTVFYDTDISAKEIPLFRGAVLKSLGDKADLLYHNHTSDDTFRYAYPQIQYKRLGGKASIVCVEQGADLIGQLLSDCPETMMLGEREAKTTISKIVPKRMLVQTWETMFDYQMKRWLPLNSKNYHAFQLLESLTDKILFLENILKANLLSMLKGLDIHLETQLMLSLTKLGDPYVVHHKGVGLTAFDVDFKCNLSIPNYLGIGKNASMGYGVIRQLKEKKEKQDTEEQEEVVTQENNQ